MKVFKPLVLIALVSVAFTSCKESKKENSEEVVEEVMEVEEVEVVEETPNIVGVAAGNEAFSTLVAAVKAAGLVETLSGEGPFTVFAPTNDAFAKLPEGTVAGLLEPESKDQLTAILTYHVVAGKFEAAAVIEAINGNDGKFTVDTVQGGKIDLSLDNGNVVLTDANGNTSVVVIPDVAASNGVIHAIDTVVMPQ
jgi:uncharacterized surface protein with fasciclin (FAS1) repeats